MSNDRLADAVSALSTLVSRLRGPEGCPWDAKQTAASIRMYLLEEAYEVVEAVEAGSAPDVCQELGDLLFHIMFLTSLAQERGEFDLTDVVKKITEKMINRHPHVFGKKEATSPEEISKNWKKIKIKERGGAKAPSFLLEEIPISLPALLRGHRLSDRAAKVDFDWENRDKVWDKVKEEFKELEQGILDQRHDHIAEEMGDLMMSLVTLARHWGLNAEEVMRNANQKFIGRFKEMEEKLRASDIQVETASLAEMNRAWEEIKKKEGQ
ncbi:MAG: nucleoside triphosphate pyrophosphohydrolase [Deltaproteobacteria bacterium]|nr:nucleoside triphosphate pyrophosphohydrolase [Deltaproteobacteria bacterium]